jgi:hypothetical protein
MSAGNAPNEVMSLLGFFPMGREELEHGRGVRGTHRRSHAAAAWAAFLRRAALKHSSQKGIPSFDASVMAAAVAA